MIIVFFYLVLLIVKNAGYSVKGLEQLMYAVTGRDTDGSFAPYPEVKTEAGYTGDWYGGVTRMLSEMRDPYRLCDTCKTRPVAYLSRYKRGNHEHIDALCVECCLAYYGIIHVNAT